MASKILVVDGAAGERQASCDLLRALQYPVIEAASGAEAFKAFQKNPDIRLVLVAHVLPDMTGCELVKDLRAKRGGEELAIIGVCGKSGSDQSARFLECGVNDYLSKPFSKEELECRIAQNLLLMDLRAQIAGAQHKDKLTGLYHRGFFLEMGRRLFEKARRGDITVAIAILDIDGFRAIQDAHGLAGADAVLIHVAKLLRKSFRASDLMARFEGDAFCIMAPDMDPDSALGIFDRLRQQIEKAEIKAGNHVIKATVTIAVAVRMRKFLDEMIQEAETALAQAKSAGGNRVVIAGAE